jgi:hypothetical protein
VRGHPGVSNTGNAQNQTSLIQYGFDANDLECEGLGSSIEVSPENSTTCTSRATKQRRPSSVKKLLVEGGLRLRDGV